MKRLSATLFWVLFIGLGLSMCDQDYTDYWAGIQDSDLENDAGNDTDTGTSDDTVFITVWKTNNPGESGGDQIRLPLVPNGEYDFTVEWGDGTTDTIDYWFADERTHTYPQTGTYQVEIKGLVKGWAFRDSADEEKLLEIKSWGPFGFGDTFEYFDGCKHLEISATDIPSLEGTTSLRSAFQDCVALETIPGIQDWDTSSVTDMGAMFYGAVSFNQDLNGWDTSNVTDMSEMFQGALTFNGDISAWDTSSLTTIKYMFSGAAAFNQDIGNWDTSNVTDLWSTFSSATAFNADISSWDTSNVVRMEETFFNAEAFNQDIGGWNTSNVESMFGTFYRASSFDQDISAWDIRKVTNMDMMFFGITLSTGNYDALFVGFESQDVSSHVFFHGGSSQYSAGEPAEARQRLIDDHNWTITDGGVLKIK